MLQKSGLSKDQARSSQRFVQLLISALSDRLILYSLAIGITLRIITALIAWQYWNSEAQSVATALASGRGFADTWYTGQGPTAHLMPVAPSVAAITYAIFGHGTVGESLRISYAILVTVGCYALAAICCMLAGLRWSLCRSAFIFLLIIPVHSFTEAVRWQDWEGGLATLFGLSSLALLLASEKGHLYPADRILRCTMPAVTFLINPIVGLAVGLATALFIFRHRREIGFLGPMLAILACAAVVVSPWSGRNYLVFGSTIVTRSNLGLELAVANHPDAVNSADPANAFINRIRQIHPHENPRVQQEMAIMGGEIAYNRRLLKETISWMRSRPSDVTLIWFRHLQETLFPPRHFFELEHEDFGVTIRVLISSLISILSLIALLFAWARRDRKYSYIAAYIFVVVAAGLPFQPVTRYIWPIYPLFACLAFDGLSRSFCFRERTSSASKKVACPEEA